MMYSRINWEVIINQEMILYQRKRGKLIMSKAELAIEKKYNGKCNCAQAVACSFAEEAGVELLRHLGLGLRLWKATVVHCRVQRWY